jgi:hypothetical protein
MAERPRIWLPMLRPPRLKELLGENPAREALAEARAALQGLLEDIRGMAEALQGEPKPPEGPGPGCVVADETLTVKGHLEGLAKGLGGFGVLRTSAERLARAADAARSLGEEELASSLEAIRGRLPSVRTPEAAREALQELERIVPKAWELGKGCKHGKHGRAGCPECRLVLESLPEFLRRGKGA